MATVTSNLVEYQPAFAALINDFNLTVPGKDQSLGRDMATEACLAIVERSVADQQDATGGTFKATSPKYTASKLRKFSVDLVGVRSGQMLSLESVKGEITVEPEVVTIKYGTGEVATRSSTGGQLRSNEPTDRQKADWFTQGGRPFFGLLEADHDRVQGVARAALAEYLENH